MSHVLLRDAMHNKDYQRFTSGKRLLIQHLCDLANAEKDYRLWETPTHVGEAIGFARSTCSVWLHELVEDGLLEYSEDNRQVVRKGLRNVASKFRIAGSVLRRLGLVDKPPAEPVDNSSVPAFPCVAASTEQILKRPGRDHFPASRPRTRNEKSPELQTDPIRPILPPIHTASASAISTDARGYDFIAFDDLRTVRSLT